MMKSIDVQVAVIGSGFGGSLMSLILQRLGLSTVLVESGRHPRFAIGESSTPIANAVLRDLSNRYHLPQLIPLANYENAKATYPDISMGIKRGFSYFAHEMGRAFVPAVQHRNELLAAANRDDAHADTHWLRADVDGFLVDQVKAAGISYLDRTRIIQVQRGSSWSLSAQREAESLEINASFVIDASGQSSLLAKSASSDAKPSTTLTHSRALYSHFRGVNRWEDVFVKNGGCVQDHPFPCDNAAVHHLMEGGWMWQLRFRGGLTSVGIAIDNDRYPLDPSVEPLDEWQHWIRSCPSIAEQMAEATIAETPGRIIRTGRLQRRCNAIFGDGWVALPNAAGFIDPLHSTGIAQTLCGVERLALALEDFADHASFHRHLDHHQNMVRCEFELVDQLVHGCYRAMDNFQVFSNYLMMYFAAATTYEHRRHVGQLKPGSAFLCADDQSLRELVGGVYDQLRHEPRQKIKTSQFATGFAAEVACAIAPYNIAGLCDPTVQNMYRYTAASVED